MTTAMIDFDPEDHWVVTEEQDQDPAERGWVSNADRKPNGSRVREDFEVDERFSSTNTTYGGSDPAKLPEGETATFDPTDPFTGEL